MKSEETLRKTESRKAAVRWFAVAVGALMLAGMFSLGLIVGRTPPFSEMVGDPAFFRRCLVVHVDLALIVWFYAVIAGVFQTLGVRGGAHSSSNRGVVVAAIGVVALVGSAGIPHAEPVLANYVPVVDHPLFIGGLIFIGIGVLSAMVSRRLVFGEETEGFFPIPDDARPGLKATSVALIGAALTFYGAWLVTPTSLEPGAYYEFVAWGGGHVLQAASETAMVAIWLILLGSLLGREVLGRRKATWLFALLVTPHLAMPALTMFGTDSAAYHVGATRLMQWAIFPVVLVILGLCVRELYRAYRAGELDGRLTDPRLLGFATSAGLTLTGFVIGAMIRGSNTMIPAHYHAVIGAVTVAFMTLGAMMLAPERYDIEAPGLLRGNSNALARFRDSWPKLQPALFGVGQLVFAIGFGFAGAHGMGRKSFGADQQVRSIAEWAGLGVMGIGGLIAVVGGLLFVFMVIAAVVPVVRPYLPTRRRPSISLEPTEPSARRTT